MGRILIVSLFAYFYVKNFSKIKILFKNNNLAFFIVALFVINSLSIVNSVNLASFYRRYKDVVLSFLVFFLFYFNKEKYKVIVKIMLFSLVINFVYQFLLLFYEPSKSFFSLLIYENHFKLVLNKLNYQNRLYIDTYDEILVPFLFLSARLNISGLFLFVDILLSFLSNIRSRILMIIFSLFSSIFTFRKAVFKTFIILLLLFIVGFFIDRVSLLSFNQSFVDRFFYEDKIENQTIDFRLKQIEKAIEIGEQKLFGLGLGNYYDYLTNAEKNNLTLSRGDLLIQAANEYVHNIFGLILSETGLIGLFLFIVIIANFMINDIKTLKKENDYRKGLVIAFWILFSYGLFNPIVPFSYQFLFWGLRGLLVQGKNQLNFKS